MTPCGTYASLMTLVVLEPILIPAGVHIANRGRGSFGAGVFASLVAGEGSLYVASRADLGMGMLVAIPAFQIAVSALAERRSEINREQK